MSVKIRIDAPESNYHGRVGVIVYRTPYAVWVKLGGAFSPLPFPQEKIKAY